VVVDTGGYRFESDCISIRDPDLLPGAVRYGDVPALLALAAASATAPLLIIGESKVPQMAMRSHAAALANATGSRVAPPQLSAGGGEAVVSWLLLGANKGHML
jgi:hypothetical protein